jgi:BirA family biotin operon repressor/biotin-[acetyl-CoA-carboxylase] ligase
VQRSTISGEAPVPAAILAALEAVHDRAGAFGATLCYLPDTGSTNDVAARLALEGAPHGTIVLADAQTRGRGRQGRAWFSPPGAGLYFSVVVRPAPGANEATEAAEHTARSLLTLVAGVAVAQGIDQASGLRASIKWPNDLVVETGAGAGRAAGRRKLAGILAEASVTGGTLQHVVLGIGINVHDSAYPPDLADRVTSIARETAGPVDRARVFAECVAALAERWADVIAGRADRVLVEWRSRSPSATGALVQVVGPEGPLRGLTCGLDAGGALCVDVDGVVHRIVAGEVLWL